MHSARPVDLDRVPAQLARGDEVLGRIVRDIDMPRAVLARPLHDLLERAGMRLAHARRQFTGGNDQPELVGNAQRRDLASLHFRRPVGDDGARPAVCRKKAEGVGARGDIGAVLAIERDQIGNQRRAMRDAEAVQRAVENILPDAGQEQLAARAGNDSITMQAAQMRLDRGETAEGEIPFQIERIVEIEDENVWRRSARRRRHCHTAAWSPRRATCRTGPAAGPWQCAGHSRRNARLPDRPAGSRRRSGR